MATGSASAGFRPLAATAFADPFAAYGAAETGMRSQSFETPAR